MSIVKLTHDHIDQLAQVHTRSWQVGYRGQLPQDLLDELEPARRAEMWRRWLDREGDDLLAFVARDEHEQVIGFTASGEPRDDDVPTTCGELYAIYVEPDRWSGGIGTELLTTTTDALREAGYDRATLWVLSSNQRSRRFYERHGWEPDGREKVEPWGDSELHEVRYAIALQPSP